MTVYQYPVPVYYLPPQSKSLPPIPPHTPSHGANASITSNISSPQYPYNSPQQLNRMNPQYNRQYHQPQPPQGQPQPSPQQQQLYNSQSMNGYYNLPSFYYYSNSMMEKKSKSSTTWTQKEDKLLRELKEQQKLGWREISSFFNDRTPNACQFRWRRIISSINATNSHGTTKKINSRSSSISSMSSINSSTSLHSNNSSVSSNSMVSINKKSHHSINYILN